MKQQNRPVFLDLTKIKFPPMAIASILHRLSGVLLFLALPFILWALNASLVSAESFYALVYALSSPVAKLIIWGVITALFYHIVAGIRHLIMDMGHGETLKAGRNSAYAIFILTVLFVILSGFWIW